MQRLASWITPVVFLIACSGEKPEGPAAEPVKQAIEPTPPPVAAPVVKRGLVLALAQFDGTTPKPARAELLTPGPDTWKVEGLVDSDSNVFHKAFALGNS